MKLLLILLFPLVIFAQTPLEKVEKLIENKQYAKAQGLLTNHIAEHPKDLKAIELLGDIYVNQQIWDNAIKQYKILVDTENHNANYHYKYGGAMGLKALQVNKLKALTMIDDIKEAFTRAADLDAAHIETRWALVELYMQLPAIIGGSKDKAMKFATELEEISKVDGYLAKGYIFEQEDEPQRAEKYYKAAINLGGSMTCYEKLTSFYEAQKEPQKAIENLEQANIKHNRNALHYQIGKVAAEYNIELNKGEICLITYIKNYNASDGVPIAWARYRLAQIYKYKGNKTEALRNIELAITDLPKIKTFQNEREKILRL